MEEKDYTDKYFAIIGLLGIITLGVFLGWAFHCNTDCQKQRNWEQQQTQIMWQKVTDERKAEQERLAEIERNKTPEQKQLEVMQKQEEHLNDIENAQNIQTTISVLNFLLN